MTVLRSILSSEATGRRRWLFRSRWGRGLLWCLALDLAVVLGLLCAGVIPRLPAAPQCPAPELVAGTDPPTVEVVEGDRANEFLVHVNRATCVLISFDLRSRPDRHRIWHLEQPIDKWRSEIVAVGEDVDAPYAATVVGAGGTATAEGVFKFRALTP